MSRRGRAPLAALVGVLLGVVAAGCGDEGPPPTAEVERVARAIAPSIVSVAVSGDAGSFGGTGVVWSRDGLVVTAHHVVEPGGRVTVRDAGGRESRAEVVATDSGLDLALLRVPWDDARPARFAGVLPEVGALAVTVGRPPTDGRLRWEGGRIEELHAAAFRLRGWDDLLMSNADVRHGDSGGALTGEGPTVYGIVLASDLAAGLTEESAGDRTYAVAATRVRAFVERALSGDRAEPGFLGVDAAEITPALGERLGLDRDAGVVILAVEPGTPADRAGLRFEDVVVKIGGAPIERLADLDDALRGLGPGTAVTLVVERDGVGRSVAVVLGRRPVDAG